MPQPQIRASLKTAESILAHEELLDIAVVAFDPGIPPQRQLQDRYRINPGVREAESRYVPYVLRQTLEASGQWGSVRVVPSTAPFAELLVIGHILDSTGSKLNIHIRVVDASGREWLNGFYTDSAGWAYYRDMPGYDHDPFRNLYNKVANDLAAFRDTLSAADLRRIQEISEIRYAQTLSPEAFDGFLEETEDGRFEAKRLPARSDPMLARTNRLRQSEYLFIDTVDAQFAEYYKEMGPVYSLWRRYNYGQTMELEDLKQSRDTDARGFLAMKQSYDLYKESKLQQQALKELSEAFDTELSPSIVELQGGMVQLNGSATSQYAEWRRLLREIYSEETGLD